MKRYLVLVILGLSACETPAELAARKQLDAACLDGNIQACAAWWAITSNAPTSLFKKTFGRPCAKRGCRRGFLQRFP